MPSVLEDVVLPFSPASLFSPKLSIEQTHLPGYSERGSRKSGALFVCDEGLSEVGRGSLDQWKGLRVFVV